MSWLPRMRYKDGITKSAQVQFGGLRHSITCQDGQIYDMRNMSCRDYPFLTSTEQREVDRAFDGNVTAFYCNNGAAVYIVGNDLHYAVGEMDLILGITTGSKESRFIRFGDMAILIPDGIVVNLTYRIRGIRETVEDLPIMGVTYEAYAVPYLDNGVQLFYNIYVWDGNQWVNNGRFDKQMYTRTHYMGMMFTNDTIYGIGSKELIEEVYGFRPGDAVTITGCTGNKKNNKTAVIREITDDGAVKFTAYTFQPPKGTGLDDQWSEDHARMERKPPKLAVAFEHDNRLWAADGKEIYASAMGDPCNWYVFDGISTDSWYIKTQAKGGIVGGFSNGSYPCFLTEDSMIIVYGTMPSAYQLYEKKVPGLKPGEENSIVQAGGYQFWLSGSGMVAYDGDSYSVMEDVFGDWPNLHIISRAGGGLKAYMLAQTDSQESPQNKSLLIYDSKCGQWTREDGDGLSMLNYDQGAVRGLEQDEISTIYLLDRENGSGEGMESWVEFGDFLDGSPNVKAVNRIQLRVGMEPGSSLKIYISHDDEPWRLVKTITGTGKRKQNVLAPVKPKRCDHYRLRLEGTGKWWLYSMAKEYYVGSDESK